MERFQFKTEKFQVATEKKLKVRLISEMKIKSGTFTVCEGSTGSDIEKKSMNGDYIG